MASAAPLYGEATTWDVDRPWLPQPCDTADTFAWFALFLSLPRPRDLRNLARAGCAVPTVRLQGIAQACLWYERAECYDAHLNAIRLSTIEREVESAAEGHARRISAIKAVTELGHAEVRRLVKAAARLDETGGAYPGSIRPELAVRAVVHGVRTEALLLGAMPPELASEADLSGLADEEVEQLADLTRKAERARK